MSKTTRDIILATASRLFADRGYDNTSIRDIAKEADANVSAINYHFKSKAGLYAEVLNQNTHRMSEVMAKISETTDKTEDLAEEVYKYFMDESSTFLNSVKMFFMNNLPLDKELMPKACLEDAKGPPGVLILMETIRKEVSFTNEDETLLLWAARNILHNITMIALVSQSTLIKMKNDELIQFTEAEKIESIKRNVRATLNFIR
ncbi:TetR/AcrR family transcriptional regulator [Halobacteriovorax sp. GFR7]|uniref:TetR/AcrR family transcriptional regulator n=1 Tax=unclassified Halobacteriovorax TaxID=2639665 RepID=UPI003D98EBFB